MHQGLSFREVLDDLRNERAEHLLSNRSLSVFEVAQRLGFEEQASFTRAFRRWTGMAPQRWRQAHLGGGDARATAPRLSRRARVFGRG